MVMVEFFDGDPVELGLPHVLDLVLDAVDVSEDVQYHLQAHSI